MKLELESIQVINILQSLRSEYANAKVYYEEHQNQEDRTGITSPDEFKEIYNAILAQAQEQGELNNLKLMSK